ncbi:MAG: alpha/beta hydrolase, partial [Verrucomicrobiota bacterium]
HMFRDHIERLLPSIQVPTLIIRGEKDPTMPMRWAQEAAELLPDARLVVIPDEAHCAHYSAPGVVAADIVAHARSSERSESSSTSSR